MNQNPLSKIQEEILDLLEKMEPIPRTEFVIKLFTARINAPKISDLGHNALQFKELRIGQKFIHIPLPSDEGHGGLKQSFYSFVKTNECADQNDSKLKTSIRLKDGGQYSNQPDQHIIAVE